MAFIVPSLKGQYSEHKTNKSALYNTHTVRMLLVLRCTCSCRSCGVHALGPAVYMILVACGVRALASAVCMLLPNARNVKS